MEIGTFQKIKWKEIVRRFARKGQTYRNLLETEEYREGPRAAARRYTKGLCNLHGDKVTYFIVAVRPECGVGIHDLIQSSVAVGRVPAGSVTALRARLGNHHFS